MLFSIREMTVIVLLLIFAVMAASAAPPEKNKTTPKRKSDVHWSRLVTITRQLDAIDREAWWVLIGNRPPLTKSIFGKIQRAAQNEEGQKLSQKNLFSCDKYNMNRKILGVSGFPQKILVYHSCRKDQELFAEVDWKQKEKLDFTFSPGPLGDVLGLNASILGKKIVCEVTTDDAGIVQNFSCKNMAKDRNATELVELDIYQFKKQDSSQLTLKGQITENLMVKKKIESLVPLAGRIKVTETEIAPPPGYRRKSAVMKSSPPASSGPVPPIESQAPPLEGAAAPMENPDQLVKKIEQQQLAPSPQVEGNLNVPVPSGQHPLAEPEYIEDNGVSPSTTPELPASRR